MTYPLGGHGVVNYTRGIIYPSIFDSAVQLIDPSDLTTVNGVSVGDPLAQIDDITGNGNNYVQGTAGDKPILRDGYIEGVSSDYMLCGKGVSKLAASTFLVVFKVNATSIDQVVYGDSDSTGTGKSLSSNIRLRSDNKIWSQYGNSSTFRTTEVAGPITTATTSISRRFPADSGVLVELEIDGAAQSEVDQAGTATSITGTAYQMGIFRPGERSAFNLDGRIYFKAVWDSRLSDANMEIASDYVIDRFGL
jgi:hypothetical protein